jgi:hypothetical protein
VRRAVRRPAITRCIDVWHTFGERLACDLHKLWGDRVLRARNPDGKDHGFKLKHEQGILVSRREDAMGMHERWSGEYEYDIEVLPLVPPMSNGNSHEAKVARFDRRQRSSRLDSVSPLSFGLRRAKTEAEAVQMVEADVENWISER